MRIAWLLVVASLALPKLHSQNDWPTYGHDPGGQRFSPLTQINASNVTKLVPAWSYQMKKEGQAFPLEPVDTADD
jgi:glucose dehydrogenase